MSFMILTSLLDELIEDQMLQYCSTVLNNNDRAFTKIYVYMQTYVYMYA